LPEVCPDRVDLPIHQAKRLPLSLNGIVLDLFKLRNAFAHGRPTPSTDWLTAPGQRVESGYAYHLWEQTEIILRLALLTILEDARRFAVFTDAGSA